MDPYKEFNHALKFFMRELMKVFPDVSELKLMFGMYKMMKTLGRKRPQKYFQELVQDHYKELLARDATYFLSMDPVDPTLKKIIVPLKGGYERLDAENQDAIWQHMTALYFLSSKCEGKFEHKVSQPNVNQDGLQVANP